MALNHKKQRGVSLTELAIVVSIIGLLLASIVGGTSLLSAAKVKKLIVEIEATKSAIDEFNDRYGYLPGDFSDATTVLSAVDDGNGNTIVEGPTNTQDTPLEDLLVWNHLASAELIRGSYSGADASASARYQIGDNAYTSDSFSNGVYSFKRWDSTYDSSYYGTTGTVIKLGTVIDIAAAKQGLPYGGVVTARDAFAVDSKIDDGNPSKGYFYTVRRHPNTGESAATISSCVTGAHTDTTAEYKLDDSSKECHLVYWYKKD